jgi:hypothetical protein
MRKFSERYGNVLANKEVIRNQVLRRNYSYRPDIATATSNSRITLGLPTAVNSFSGSAYSEIYVSPELNIIQNLREFEPNLYPYVTAGSTVWYKLEDPYSLCDFALDDLFSPFDELREDRVRLAKDVLRHATRERFAIPTIVQKLDALIDDAQEEFPETQIPSAQSIVSTLAFFMDHRNLQIAALSLTPSGNPWAEWHGDAERSAAIEFLPNGSIGLAAMFPDADEPWRRTSIAGNFGRREAGSLLHQFGSLHWIYR